MKKVLLSLFILFFVSSFVYAETTSEITAANFLAWKGFIADNSATPVNYRLSETITRKEMIKIVAKVAGGEVAEKCEGKFSDVASDWGCKYIEWALKEGFISSNNGKFRPNENITKTESLKLIFKARGIQKIYNTSNWQEDYMKTAYDLKLIEQQYTDYNTNALRGGIFSVIYKTYNQQIENQTYSDESNIQ
jgi:hypothetical protein